MADDIDRANEIAQMEVEAAITNAKRQSGNQWLTGFCQWCEEPTKGAFCSASCRNDANAYARMKG